jgi:methyl-accepting chemotaxis protein
MLARLGNLSLKSRLLAGFGAVLFLFVSITAVGINQVNTIDKSLTVINQVNSVKQRYAINFRGSVHDRAIELRDVVLFDSAEGISHAVETIERLAKFYADSAGPLDTLMTDASHTVALEHDILAEIKGIETKTLPLIERVVALRAQDKVLAHTVLMEQARPQFIAWLAAINKFIDFQEEKNRVAAKTASSVAASFQNLMLLVCGFSFLIGVAVALWCLSSVRPLRELTGSMLRLADGQLHTEIPNINTKDEVGQIISAVRIFKSNALAAKRADEDARAEQQRRLQQAEYINKTVAQFEKSAEGAVNTVAAAATEMKASFDNLGRIASDTSVRAAAATTAASQASGNVQTVASATEELTASIREISSQVQTSARTAQDAVTKASQTNQKVAELAEASQRIGEVVQLISEIANQTNLLALNATIEAARAGEAGKGFAVVASEVKNLASQTAKATEEISAQIASMQAATGETVGAIREIGETIKELDRVATAIAAAVEQQGSATQEIARNVQEAAHGTSAVTANIEAVSTAAGETGSAVGGLQGAAAELSQQAETLRHEVETFISKVRTA